MVRQGGELLARLTACKRKGQAELEGKSQTHAERHMPDETLNFPATKQWPEPGIRSLFPATGSPQLDGRFTVSRRTRTPSRKYKFRRVCHAGDLSCASRCGSTCRTWGSRCSCSCPSP